MDNFDLDTTVAQLKGVANKRKWIFGLLAVLIIGPIAWFLVSAVVGIAALGVVTTLVLLLTLFIINVVIPTTMDKIANARIDYAVAEATKNPLGTLKNDHLENKRAREEDNQSITEYDTNIGAIKQDLAQLTADLGPEGVAQFKVAIQEMEADRDGMIADLAQFDADIEKQRTEIKRLEAFWKLSGAVDAANAKVNARRAGEALRQIKNDAAYAAVNTAVARSRAQLRERVRNRRNSPMEAKPAALENNPSTVIDMELARSSAHDTSYHLKG